MGNNGDFNEASILLHEMYEKIPGFSLTILVGTSLVREAFLLLNLFISFRISSMVTSLKKKILFFYVSLTARVLA